MPLHFAAVRRPNRGQRASAKFFGPDLMSRAAASLKVRYPTVSPLTFEAAL